MLWAIVVILLLFWVLGLVSNVVGGLIHIVLAVVVVLIVMQLLQGRRSA